MTKQELAKSYFLQGYNCCQALVLAFKDEIDIDEKTLLKISSPFGGGMGRLREVCGAVSGMFMVLGMICGYDNLDNPNAKAELYARVQELAKKYEEENGSIVCRELLGLSQKRDDPTPEIRNEAYYKNRPCPDKVGSAAKILEEYIKNNNL